VVYSIDSRNIVAARKACSEDDTHSDSTKERAMFKKIAVSLTALTLLSGAGFAFPADYGHMPWMKTAHKRAAINCPVTGNKIASASKAAGKSVYKGKTYYFCCPGCKPKFDKNPAEYADKAAAPKTPKAKTTPGVMPAGHDHVKM
jgi:YHS domain-containing protein